MFAVGTLEMALVVPAHTQSTTPQMGMTLCQPSHTNRLIDPCSVKEKKKNKGRVSPVLYKEQLGLPVSVHHFLQFLVTEEIR